MFVQIVLVVVVFYLRTQRLVVHVQSMAGQDNLQQASRLVVAP
jgi:hypothetical protein